MHGLQILSCPFRGAVVSLQLTGFGLRGKLPDSIGNLPLQFLDVRHNPALHGALPPALLAGPLVSLQIQGSHINCHDDVLTDAEVLAFARRLHAAHPSDWAELAQMPAEQRCIETFGVLRPAAVNVTSIRNERHCRERYFRHNSAALLPTSYVLNVGCTCPGAIRGHSKSFQL